MEMINASITYLLSILASFTLKLITPIEFTDCPCNSVYKTTIKEGEISYIVTVEQWRLSSQMRIGFLSTHSNYYIASVELMLGNVLIGQRKDFFPEPIRGFFKRTKLPHAIIALAALNKAQKEAQAFKETA